MELNNRFTTFISVSSLITSIFTLLLTSPILIDMYSKPSLVVSEVNRELDGETFRTMFILKNDGRGTAKNIEFVLNTHSTDLIQITQEFTGEKIEQDNGQIFKTVILKTPYLPADAGIMVIVTGSKKSLVTDSESYNIKDKSPANIIVPAIVSVKSENGLGHVIKQKPWIQVNIN